MENKEARLTDALHLYRWLRSLLAKRVLAPFCLRSSANRNREFSSPLVTASSTVWKVSWRAQRRRTYTRKNRCVSRMSHQALVERACAAWWREREREKKDDFSRDSVFSNSRRNLSPEWKCFNSRNKREERKGEKVEYFSVRSFVCETFHRKQDERVG